MQHLLVGRWISKSAFTVYSQRHTNLHLIIIIVNTLSKDQAIIKNLFENNNSSCFEKGTIFNEIATVVNELRIQKKAAYKEDVYNYLCKERSVLSSEAVFNNYVAELISNGNIITRTHAFNGNQTFVKPSTEEKPDSVILNIGTYDLRSDDESDKIENDIMNIATSCKQSDCDVIISALHPSWDKFNIKVKEANDSLKELFLLKNILLLEQHNFNARYQ